MSENDLIVKMMEGMQKEIAELRKMIIDHDRMITRSSIMISCAVFIAGYVLQYIFKMIGAN